MKTIGLLLVSMLAISACATQDGAERQTEEDIENQAVQDFIEVRGLETVDKIRTTERDGWVPITNYFVIYTARREHYLMEFARPCYEMEDNTRITPDYRSQTRLIHAKFDTLRGCRIIRIFPLTEAEAEELENIGEVPGSRN